MTDEERKDLLKRHAKELVDAGFEGVIILTMINHGTETDCDRMIHGTWHQLAIEDHKEYLEKKLTEW